MGMDTLTLHALTMVITARVMEQVIMGADTMADIMGIRRIITTVEDLHMVMREDTREGEDTEAMAAGEAEDSN